MAYTSYSPNDERFGFKHKGSFRCSYENQRLLILLFPIIILALIAAFVIILLTAREMVMNPECVDLTKLALEQDEVGRIIIFGFDTAVYGSYVIAALAVLIVVILLIMAYCITLGILRTGINYTFTANEQYFEICPPETKNPLPHIVVRYEDVVMVYGEERKFIFAEHGLDITIRTKKKTYMLRYIHTPESRKNGLSETPFNIIMERAGLINRPDFNI